MVTSKRKSESLIKYYIKVTCAFKWARKLPRKTVTYESAKYVPCSTGKCTHDGFVSDLLKWAVKCRFYATGPRPSAIDGFKDSKLKQTRQYNLYGWDHAQSVPSSIYAYVYGTRIVPGFCLVLRSMIKIKVNSYNFY